MPIIALVESAKGIASARMLAAHPAVVGLAFGTLDFCLDVGADHIRPVLDPMRMELVLAARLAGIAAPVDGVTADVRTAGAARADAEHARALDMGGKFPSPMPCSPARGPAEPKREAAIPATLHEPAGPIGFAYGVRRR